MSEIINIYCDESCHLENDNQNIMLLSCTYCSNDRVRQISEEIRKIKQKHKIWRFAEIKWKKVSKSKKDFYLDLLQYFLMTSDLQFRTIVIDKKQLNHSKFSQDHNTWYYKMIYILFGYIINKNNAKIYKIFFDKKENSYQSKIEVQKTKQYIKTQSPQKDFEIQNITSHQSEIMQLNDFLQGIVSFCNRNLHKEDGANPTKKMIIDEISKKLKINLHQTNYNDKFNIFIWEGQN